MKAIAFSITFVCLIGQSGLSHAVIPLMPLASIVRVSVASDGSQANKFFGHLESVISSDGRFVAFVSSASNLVPNDSNNESDVFVRDLQTNQTTLVSVTSDGKRPGLISGFPSISADGRYIAFESPSPFVYSDNRIFHHPDIFVHDRLTKQTTIASITSNGEEANGGSYSHVISGDGRYILFSSGASNFVPPDSNFGTYLFVHDRQTKQTDIVIKKPYDNSAAGGQDHYSISYDGRFVVFDASATNLVDGDTNKSLDVFLHDRLSGKTERVSISSSGEQANSASSYPLMSADGKLIVFESIATNLDGPVKSFGQNYFIHNTETGTTSRLPVNLGRYQAISSDGRYLAYQLSDSKGVEEIWAYDIQSKQVVMVSRGLNDQKANGQSYLPSISKDGQRVAFASAASNLVTGDTNNIVDIFVLQRESTGCQINPLTSQTIEVAPDMWNTCDDVRPLVFIPGISASELQAGSDVIWPTLNESTVKRLSLAPLPQGQQHEIIFASDAMRSFLGVDVYGGFIDFLKSPAGGGYREYVVDNKPSRRTEPGCDVSQNSTATGPPNLFVFAYDWRKENKLAAQQLADFIGCVRRFFPSSKIDIVAHSMGGLVARRYILDHPASHFIDKLITMGSPWLGAPKAINVLFTGKFDPFNITINTETIASLVEYFPGMHELLPSKSYFDLGERPYLQQQLNLSGQTLTNALSYDQMANLLDSRFQSRPAGTSQSFHSYQSYQQDSLNNDASGVNYYVIYGRQDQPTTIGQFIEKRACTNIVNAPNCRDATDLSIVDGDGTVPVVSAARSGNGLKLYGSATITEITSSPVEHAKLPANLEIRQAVADILKRASALNIRSESKSSLVEHNLLAQTPYYVWVHGSAAPSITDSIGNTNSGGKAVEGITYHALNLRTMALIVNRDQTYTITLPKVDMPFMFEVKNGWGDATSYVARYNDANVQQGQSVQIVLSPNSVGELKQDSDGNGTFETVLQPSAQVSGTAARDDVPPTISIGATKIGSNLEVSIVASDSGAGIDKVYYSLTESNFMPYTQALAISQSSADRVYVFADDKAGNRSTIYSYSLVRRNVFLPITRK